MASEKRGAPVRGRCLSHNQTLDFAPGYYLCAGALLGIIAAVHDVASNTEFLARVFQAHGKALKVPEKIRRRGGARFDLDGIQSLSLLDEQVDFKSTCLPVVKQLELQIMQTKREEAQALFQLTA
jgi:hypothetical protein